MTLSDNDAAIVLYHTTMPQCLREGLPPPDLATVKDFLRFHVAISRRRIDDERISVDSGNTFTLLPSAAHLESIRGLVSYAKPLTSRIYYTYALLGQSVTTRPKSSKTEQAL